MKDIPLISIITACYNDGVYLDEMVGSIQHGRYGSLLEHIIVNDGSTDLLTLNKLIELEGKGITVLNQNNKGLGNARNAGINIAKGKYIIPLDCDNKLAMDVIIRCADLLEREPTLDVVYTDAIIFGRDNELWRVGKFNHLRLLNRNFIDACAVFRKTMWQQVGGYDEHMPKMGHEDWEFWLNIYFHGGNFFYFQEIGFHYRVVSGSMSSDFNEDIISLNRNYIFKKHSEYIASWYAGAYNEFLSRNSFKFIFAVFQSPLIKWFRSLWFKISGFKFSHL